MKPELLVVIPTFGAFDYAARAVRSALGNTRWFDPWVIVIDDASPEWVEPHAPKQISDLWSLDVRLTTFRFPQNGGLTRSWNCGLQFAKDRSIEFCCVANSDLYFPPGWDRGMSDALTRQGCHLVGPVTNAPGTEQAQYVGKYSLLYRKDRIDEDADKVQEELRGFQTGRVKETPLNGFCLAAKTETWWNTAYDKDHVFRPRNDFNSKGEPNPTPLMTLNEYELQARWRAKGLKIAAALSSYVVHYRAVSRGDAFKRGDWVRRKEPPA